MNDEERLRIITNFLFEVGILAKTPRTGFRYLGTGNQSVAEHVYRMLYVGYVLAKMEGNVGLLDVLFVCFFHDLVETRTDDKNPVHKEYVYADEKRAISDLTSRLEFGSEIAAWVKEYQERQSKVACIAHDADELEWILSLKEQHDCGNPKAEEWMGWAIARLKTRSGRLIAGRIIDTHSDDWWRSFWSVTREE